MTAKLPQKAQPRALAAEQAGVVLENRHILTARRPYFSQQGRPVLVVCGCVGKFQEDRVQVPQRLHHDGQQCSVELLLSASGHVPPVHGVVSVAVAVLV